MAAMALAGLLCLSAIVLLFNGSAGFSMEKVHKKRQSPEVRNRVPDKDLYWQPSPRTSNVLGPSGLVRPQSPPYYEPGSLGTQPPQVYPPSSGSVAVTYGSGDLNGGRKPLVFEEVYNLPSRGSPVFNYPPLRGVQPEYPSNAVWPYNFPRDFYPPSDDEEDDDDELEDKPRYIVQSRNGHQRLSFWLTKASYSPQAVNSLAGYYDDAKKHHFANYGGKH
ncbi:uncharacterized protein LOC130904639 [Corythoichthys intestinalis]|uniref:uncharacterized protein LOC130904639 n=1 Tax=Corythoichthys intestinalis TaxID=161448 RepID=UPI0025A58397|nr:uncharacterized protein LOC130904639 [Corythoichthys intestinalis]